MKITKFHDCILWLWWFFWWHYFVRIAFRESLFFWIIWINSLILAKICFVAVPCSDLSTPPFSRFLLSAFSRRTPWSAWVSWARPYTAPHSTAMAKAAGARPSTINFPSQSCGPCPSVDNRCRASTATAAHSDGQFPLHVVISCDSM